MPKKISIKSLKPIFDMTETIQKQLEVLENGINSILNSRIPETSFQELYLITEHLQNTTHREDLYQIIHCVIKTTLLKQCEELSHSVNEILDMLNRNWILIF